MCVLVMHLCGYMNDTVYMCFQYLALALLVLQGAVQQDDAGVLDHSAHAGVSDVLVDHHAF